MIRTKDAEVINSVLTHPAIWPCIADGSPEGFEPPLTDDYHYLYEEGVLFILHPLNDDWEIHANVLPEYRSGAFDAGQAALKYAFDVIKANKVIARIPTEYPNVYQFSLKSGLQDAGIVDGEHYLTLEREQWAS